MTIPGVEQERLFPLQFHELAIFYGAERDINPIPTPFHTVQISDLQADKASNCLWVHPNFFFFFFEKNLLKERLWPIAIWTHAHSTSSLTKPHLSGGKAELHPHHVIQEKEETIKATSFLVQVFIGEYKYLGLSISRWKQTNLTLLFPKQSVSKTKTRDAPYEFPR